MDKLKSPKPVWEKISLALLSLNILFYLLFLVGSFLVSSQIFVMPFRLFTPIIALLGLISGLIAIIIKRVWLGLVLNFLFILLILTISWIYRACCS